MHLAYNANRLHGQFSSDPFSGILMGMMLGYKVILLIQAIFSGQNRWALGWPYKQEPPCYKMNTPLDLTHPSIQPSFSGIFPLSDVEEREQVRPERIRHAAFGRGEGERARSVGCTNSLTIHSRSSNNEDTVQIGYCDRFNICTEVQIKVCMSC